MIPTSKITVGVHPIDTVKHPTYPPGFRWCVMVGDGAWHEVQERCANAGWAPDQQTATAEGDQAGVTAAEAFRLLGVPCQWGGVIQLEHDPIPSEADDLPLISYALKE